MLNRIAEHVSIAGKKRCIAGAVLTAALIILVLTHMDLYLDPELVIRRGASLIAVSCLFAAINGLLIALKISLPEKIGPVFNSILFILMPVVTMQIIETFNNRYVYYFYIITFLLNYMVIAAFYCLIFMISGSYRITVIMVNIAAWIWSVACHFVSIFRGTPLVPMDIVSWKTGLSVSGAYDYSLSWHLILGTEFLIFAILVGLKMKSLKFATIKGKLGVRLIPAAALAVMIPVFFFTDFPANIGYKPDFWNQMRGYKKTGSFFNFCLNTKYLFVTKPEGYDVTVLRSGADDFLTNNGILPEGQRTANMLTGGTDYLADTDGQKPNIICIMNESLADLSQVGYLRTNEDYMPFMRSLEENTIKGYVTMPVYGAGTSNSEFEFLSGDSLAMLPIGCNVYESYVKDNVPTLVSNLKDQGYSATAFHPYYAAGWQRDTVYPLLGFENYYAIEDLIDEDILNNYKTTNDISQFLYRVNNTHPGENMLLRRYVCDDYDYRVVEDLYEKRDQSKPFFIFNVTMQNHGGYAETYLNFHQSIYATNLMGTYRKANQYLSLVKESDKAFEKLIDYFSKVEEPTIICMFGDHLPSLESGFYQEVMGKNLDELTLEEEELRYRTPFFIWANYDIPEATIDQISANYLSTLLLQVAGLEMTDYNRFLASLYQRLPVINTVGYADSEGNYYGQSQSSEYDDLLELYDHMNYNNLIDRKNRLSGFYRLPGAEAAENESEASEE